MGYGDAHRLMLMQGVGIAMQRMHQSYKCMKAQQNKLSGCASNLLAHEDLGHLRRPIVGIYKPSSIMKNSHQYMKVTKQKTLYHEDYGATLKHKCGKGQQHCPFSLFLSFFGPSLFYGLYLPSFFNSSLGTMLQRMMIITLLFIYNSMITTRCQNKRSLYMNASGGVPGYAMNQV